MNSPVIALRVAGALFGLACLGQLLRLLMQLEIVVAGHHVPLWPSGLAVVLAGALCFWLLKLSMPHKPEGHVDAPAT